MFLSNKALSTALEGAHMSVRDGLLHYTSGDLPSS